MPLEHDAYISARKQDILAALGAGEDSAPGPNGSRGGAVSDVLRLLSAVLSHEARQALEGLKQLYEPLDPDTPDRRRDESPPAFERFATAFTEALQRGNFHEIDPEDVRAREATRDLTGLNVKTTLAGIRRIRYFARGAHPENVERSVFLGLRRKVVAANVYNDVIVLVGFKSEAEISRPERKAFADMRRGIRPGAAIIKHFRNVASAELVTLHPGAKPSMLNRDRVFLGVPAIAGSVPVLANLWPAMTVLFAVVAGYFTAGQVIDNDRLARAVGALGGLIALIAFVMRQRMKVEAQTLRYQKQLADTVYFRNLANNSGVLDLLIGAGEEQDLKEAYLAYWTLERAGKPMTRGEIDAAAEAFLREKLGDNAIFEIHDALDKLERLGLASRQGETYSVLAPSEALRRLDSIWDNYFKFNVTA
jgi:hypothetical protein